MVGPFAGATLADVGVWLRGGTTDPVELTERTLAAAQAAQAELNLFAALDAAGARRAASLARDELARGVDRGPLHGVPVAVKDVIDTAGLATTMGSRHFAGHLPDRDAAVVARLREAGAVIVGKTTTHEFAYGPTGDVSATGPVRNPRDPSRMAGGSSAGAAAAVAAGVRPARRRDGHRRLGAHPRGAVRDRGIRPSFGRVPTAGVFPLSWSLDTVGPLAANVADLVTGLEALSGGRVRAPVPAARTLRIGVVTGQWFDRVADPVATAIIGLVERLQGAGAEVREAVAQDAEELATVYRLVQSAEAVAVHAERLERAPESYEPETLTRLRTAAEVPAWQYATALRRLGELRAGAAQRLDGLDALLLASVPILAPPVGARDAELGGGWRSPREALLSFCSPWSVLGLPSLSLPVPAPAALPVGAQLVGRPGGDAELLAVAAAVEALAG